MEGCKRIYLHNVDDFAMNAIRKRLVEENMENDYPKYDISAVFKQQENMSKVLQGRQRLSVLDVTSGSFIEEIIECDMLVFNIDCLQFDSACLIVRQVLEGLDEWAKEQKKIAEESENLEKKYLILLSSPMTWAYTEPDLIDTDPDEEETNGFLHEDDYRRRRAHKSYCMHKLLERDVLWFQRKCKPFVKTLIVCPGIIYGEENDKLHYIFKFAFYNKVVPILKPGSQLLPLIYVHDFVKIMKQIFDEFPESRIRYIFAVQPTIISLKTFTYNITRSFNDDCSKVRYCEDKEMVEMAKELMPQLVLDEIALNIKMSADYLKTFEFHELNDDFWNTLAQEFRDARNLHPLRIIVDGPPLVGKTENALKLADFYQIIYINMSNVIKQYLTYLAEKIRDSTDLIESLERCDQMLEEEGEEEGAEEGKEEENLVDKVKIPKLDEEDKSLLSDLKERVEEWSAELLRLDEYIACHEAFEDQDFDHISSCLIALISSKQYNLNQGYVIDGFPFVYDQAKQIFYNTRRISKKRSESVDVTTIEKTEEETLRPTHIIMFDASDELLCNRAMGFTETEATIRQCLRHQMLPRIDAFRDRNDEPHCMANLFYDNKLIPMSIIIEKDTLAVDTFKKIETEIGAPFTYPLTHAQQQALNDTLLENRLKEAEAQRQRKEGIIKSLTTERERKLLAWTAKYEELRKHEKELQEVKTLPLRQYLGKYVLPTITEGILKIAELKPEDPVDFLAEYLFQCNPEGQRMPPFCTDELLKRFMDTSCTDLENSSEYFIE